MSIIATVLAFDIGASSGRALVGQLTEIGGSGQGRKLTVTEVHRFPNQAVQVGKHLHWDILSLFQEVKKGIRAAFQQGYSPEAFGIDTWGVDFGMLDANGELIGNPYHYRDPQTEEAVNEVLALIGKKELFFQSGLQNMPFNTLYQLYAMKKAASPKLDIAKTLLLTPDLLLYLLTGRKVCEFTMATTTQLYHPDKQVWNDALMSRLGIPPGLFPDPVAPGTRIGELSEEVCRELRVPPIAAIAVASHDTESAVAAIPASVAPAYLVCGTWSIFGMEQSGPVLSEEAMEHDFSNEGGAGGTYQLLKNIMGMWILQECKREWEDDGQSVSYTELVEAARKAEPFRSLIRVEDPRFYAPGDMPDKIRNYCREHGQPVPENIGAITRCILESLALTYRHALEHAEELASSHYPGLHMVGGGIQNELLCQLTANAIGRTVWAGPVEASAIGNLLLQLTAMGHCRDLQEARELAKASVDPIIYEPEAESRRSWDAAYQGFLQLEERHSQAKVSGQ
ncbi:rhamnulokinase [Gorillibacterium massiliense]|uniref:rhamnulokinase n=1 Tax=Gorillibacterium massiliense TaxID=1280390 RepID=UPI0004AEEAEE|nr:rhamnulokinase family protein [Gorillibacterium massiliense]